jgi:Prokaryotic dksA/traR C4-type zinc finger
MNEPLAQTRGGARVRLITARQRIVEEMERFRGDVDDPHERDASGASASRRFRGDVDDPHESAAPGASASRRLGGDVDDPGEPDPQEAPGLEESVTETLVAIDGALGRLDAGSYGRCEGCGDAIGSIRLEALPHAAFCVRCQRRAEDALA